MPLLLVARLPTLQSKFETFAIASLTESPTRVLEMWADQIGLPEGFEKLQGIADLSEGVSDFLDRSVLSPGRNVERRGETFKTGEAVTLSTLHVSKGLEFPVVFICGVEEGLLPMDREDSNIEEERRLLYVGMTRAKDELILTSTRTRAFQGARVRPKPSRFLDAISKDVMSREAGVVRKPLKQEQLALF